MWRWYQGCRSSKAGIVGHGIGDHEKVGDQWRDNVQLACTALVTKSVLYHLNSSSSNSKPPLTNQYAATANEKRQHIAGTRLWVLLWPRRPSWCGLLCLWVSTTACTSTCTSRRAAAACLGYALHSLWLLGWAEEGDEASVEEAVLGHSLQDARCTHKGCQSRGECGSKDTSVADWGSQCRERVGVSYGGVRQTE